MHKTLENEIMRKIKGMKCQQPDCRSGNQQTLEIAVLGNAQGRRKGTICTSCFIDRQLMADLGDVQLHALSIQKFLKVLTHSYLEYAEQKGKLDWPPTIIEEEREQIRKRIGELDKSVGNGIFNIMKHLEDSMKQALDQAKRMNQDKSLEKVYDLVSEQNEAEQERINISNEIKQITLKLVSDHGQYTLSTEEAVKKQNELILVQFKKQAARAKEAILRLLQVHKKCIKHLIE